MGRKSLATERTAQILDAFENCIVKYGLEGATLQRVADAAGMRLSMIDHYVGKRDVLVKRMVSRFCATYQQDTVAYLAQLPNENRLEHLLNFYFGPASLQYRPQDTIIINELTTLSGRDPAVREQILSIYRLFEQSFADEIARMFPHLSAENVQQTAYALLSLWYGNSTMIWLGFDKQRMRWMRHTADTILQALPREPI